VINISTSESARAVPLGRDLNRRTWASRIAAAIPDAMALMRGSILMPEASEGVAVLGGGAGQGASGLNSALPLQTNLLGSVRASLYQAH